MNIHTTNRYDFLRIGKRNFFLILFLFAFLSSYSQDANYNLLKKQGKLTGREKIINTGAVNAPPINPVINSNQKINSGNQPFASACNCWEPRDATWSVAPFTNGIPPDYRNDDGSTPQINLPFNFCLYGTQYNSLFINNNGNVSFGTAYSTFTANPFPDPNFVMVAPFWADVDTRDLASGLVYYKVTPTNIIVQWENVGYYSQHSDLLNSFQLIITNGADPLVPNGNNVSFCYQDMQWTTGDVTGLGGFGGAPGATVGANEGNGIDYIQFGTFDQPGSAYNGPTGAPSGIDWLDNQSFVFNTCGANNIPPIPNGLTVCDTLIVCVGDIYNFNILFMSPEAGQITTVTASTTMNGFTIINNIPGNNAQFDAQLIAQAINVGYNTITFTATDNGSPAATTTIVLVVQVLNAPVANAGPDVCGVPAQLNASGGTAYTWSPSAGLSNPSISNPVATPAATTTYVCTVSNGTCTDNDTVIVAVGLLVTINTNSVTCNGGTNGTASVSATGGLSAYTYQWSNGATTTSVSNLSAGTYSISVSNGNCTITNTVQINEPSVITAIFSSKADTCARNQGSASATVSGGTQPYTYLWLTSPVQLSPTIAALSSGTYTCIVTDVNGCNVNNSVTVGNIPGPNANFTPNPQVANILDPSVMFIDLSSPNVITWQWDFGDGSTGSTTESPIHTYEAEGTYLVTLIVTNASGCMDTIQQTVRVEGYSTIYVPNSFTPNGDALNELFYAKGQGMKEYNIWIFDRWGNMIWDCHYKGENTSWDGEGQEGMSSACKWDGKIAPGGADMSGASKQLTSEDVYVYVITYHDVQNTNYKLIGNVSVVK